MSRIATFPHQTNLNNQNLRIQSELANRQTQISSGLRSSTYDGIARDTKPLLDLQANINQLQTQNSSNNIVLGRMNEMSSTINTILDVMNNFTTSLNSAAISPAELETNATAALGEVVSLLNRQVEGRFLFSGAATNTAPIDINDIDYGPFTSPTAPDTDYYKGDDTILQVEAIDGFNIPYGITADNPGFEGLLRALSLVAQNPADDNAISEARTLVASSRLETIDVNQRLNINRNALSRRIDENENIITRLENQASELVNVDVTEATVELTNFETQLEASFSVLTRILNLSLVDFLR